ncbi:MAG: CDP-alcohol phosphatidyltransferase family protein [Hyphomicrobiaceae bacterium]|nr:CDP-alcohol phosphatidyltransferase family protein [Hyphomicrobiaceae bacterium]
MTPNVLTLLRLILVPVVVYLMATGEKGWAFAAFALAGVTDAADGFLAKRYGLETELGAYLDPVADKLLIVCIFVSLGLDGSLPLWLVVAVVARDVMIVSAVVLSSLLGNPVAIKPSRLSKANTAAQIVLAATVLADEAFGLGFQTLRFVLVWVTGALTVASLASYLSTWLRHMSTTNTAL